MKQSTPTRAEDMQLAAGRISLSVVQQEIRRLKKKLAGLKQDGYYDISEYFSDCTSEIVLVRQTEAQRERKEIGLDIRLLRSSKRGRPLGGVNYYVSGEVRKSLVWLVKIERKF